MSDENIDDIVALSPMQQLMLTHSITATGSRALANQFRYELRGAIDAARMHSAWQSLIDRHASLKTCFLWEGLSEPVQIVRKNVQLPYQFVDLSALEQRDRQQQLNDIFDTDRSRGFDLRRAPLMRLILVKLEDTRYCMVWSRHHLIMDRWCVDILFEELFHFYGTPNVALSAAGEFRNYIKWIKDQNESNAESYWREALRECNQPTLLFGSSSHTPLNLDGLASAQKTLDTNEYDELKSFARSNKVSIATVLQGALALLISRWTNSEKIVFGMTVSGRPPDLPDIETTVGSFINNIPVYIRVERSRLAIEWLQSILLSQQRRHAFDYLSQAKIHQCTGFKSTGPMFDLLALLHSPATEVRQGPGFEIEQIAGPLDSAYPFTLSLAENRGELEIIGAFDPDQVSDLTVEALLNPIQQTLLEFVSSPRESVDYFLDKIEIEHAHRDRAPEHTTATTTRRHAAQPMENEPGSAAAILSAIWNRILDVEDVGLDDDFFALGGTSIQAAMMFAEIEDRFDKTLPISTLFKSGNIRKLLEVLDSPLARTSAVVEIQPRGSMPPMLVVPGVGGNVVSLEPLARALGPQQPFYGLQSKGLDGRGQPLGKIEEIAAELIEETKSIRTDPYVLVGICWGAIVAFEMAHQLRAAGHPPALLIILDPVVATERKAWGIRTNRVTVLLGFIRKRLRLYWSALRDLSLKDQWRWIINKLGSLLAKTKTSGLLHGNRTELNRRLVSNRNIDAMKRYLPKVYPGNACIYMTIGRQVTDETDSRTRFLDFVSEETRVDEILGFNTGDAISGANAAVLARKISTDIERTIGATE